MTKVISVIYFALMASSAFAEPIYLCYSNPSQKQGIPARVCLDSITIKDEVANKSQALITGHQDGTPFSKTVELAQLSQSQDYINVSAILENKTLETGDDCQAFRARSVHVGFRIRKDSNWLSNFKVSVNLQSSDNLCYQIVKTEIINYTEED